MSRTQTRMRRALLLAYPVASVGPSVASGYQRPLWLRERASLLVSRSGRSPDIVEMTRMTRETAARLLAITNDPTSPPPRHLSKVTQTT